MLDRLRCDRARLKFSLRSIESNAPPNNMIFIPLKKTVAVALCALAVSLVAPHAARAGALEDWNAITALDDGPKGDAGTREQARKLMIQHFDEQQRGLQLFIAKYPDDSHAFDARMRLSHLLAIRSDLEAKPVYYAQSVKMLDDLAKQPGLPPAKQADVAYARITLFMHNTMSPDERARNILMGHVRKFQKDFPGDRRTGALLAEMASLYDADPKTKREMLDEASRYADNDGLRKRINDDLKRLAMLGRAPEVKFTSVQGEAIDIAQFKGRVVLVYFFAGWARPSVAALAELQRYAAEFPKGKFQLVVISLDKSKESLDATLAKTHLDCPVYFDGKGWDGPLVRSLGINALPTAWLIDRTGNLRSLNALDSTESQIKGLLQDK